MIYICKTFSTNYVIFDPPYLTLTKQSLVAAIDIYQKTGYGVYAPSHYIENQKLMKPFYKAYKNPVEVAKVILEIEVINDVLKNYPELLL